MNFNEMTRVMLHSMDFFELRRTAARYGIPYQGVRRNKLIRDIERKIALKNSPNFMATVTETPINGAVLAEMEMQAPVKQAKANELAPRINTYSNRAVLPRFSQR